MNDYSNNKLKQIPLQMPRDLLAVNLKSLEMDGSLIADYRTCISELKREVFMSSSCLVLIISGIKHLKSHEMEIKAVAGEFIFMKSGKYIMSQLIPPGGAAIMP